MSFLMYWLVTFVVGMLILALIQFKLFQKSVRKSREPDLELEKLEEATEKLIHVLQKDLEPDDEFAVKTKQLLGPEFDVFRDFWS